MLVRLESQTGDDERLSGDRVFWCDLEGTRVNYKLDWREVTRLVGFSPENKIAYGPEN